MLRPVRMSLISVLLLKDDEASALRALGEMESVQVESARLCKGSEALSAVDTAAAFTAIDALKSRLVQVLRHLKLEGAPLSDGEIRVDPRTIAFSIEAEFSPLEKEVAALAERVAQAERSREKADLVSWTLASLEHRGVNIRSLLEARYIGVEVGAVPHDSFLKLRESLVLAGHRVFQIGSLGRRTLICAVTSIDRKRELSEALEAARFERVDIGTDILGNGRTAGDLSQEAMWLVREEITEAGLSLSALAAKWKEKVLQWRRELEINSRLLASMDSFLEGAYASLVVGWVPSLNVASVPAALRKVCKGPVHVAPLELAPHDAHHGHAIEPPTKLSNPALVRPFEFLVKFYGYPAYDGIDPTAFVAVTFAVIFGAMFGDAGQGTLLALGGFAICYFSRKGSPLRDAGAILGWCGTMSVLFGLLYGSVFGFEFEEWRLFGHEFRTVPPLKDPAAFLLGGVICGVIIINLGLLINIAQNLWARKFKEAMLGEWGASALWFFWGALMLFYLMSSGRGEYVTPGIMAWVLIPPILLTTIGSELYDILMRRKGDHELAGLFVKPMELIMGSFSNTVSFMRVGAFAMNHAAIMATVFVFAKMLGGPGPVGAAISWIDIVLGNIMVMCLEGILVFVQVLRLHYYEFFSKFFHHQGRPFEPLTLRVERSGV